MKTLIAFVAAGLLTAAAVQELAPTVEQAARDSAEHSIGGIVYAAQIYYLLDNDWEQALADARGDLIRGKDENTVDGTTLTWRHEDWCFQADVPTHDAPVSVTSC